MNKLHLLTHLKKGHFNRLISGAASIPCGVRMTKTKLEDNCVTPKNLTFIFLIFHIGEVLKMLRNSLKRFHRTVEEIGSMDFCLKVEIL